MNGRGWLLHCGDAYFLRAEVTASGAPAGLTWFESRVAFDNKARLANQKRLRELKRDFGHEITLICSHDLAEFPPSQAPEEQACFERR